MKLSILILYLVFQQIVSMRQYNDDDNKKKISFPAARFAALCNTQHNALMNSPQYKPF